mgnify:CR=1 FL=1
MSKVRVYEVARELGVENRDLIQRIATLGIQVRNHMSVLDPVEVDRIKRSLGKDRSEAMVEERIRPTVVRRKRRKKTDEPEQAPAEATPMEAPDLGSLPEPTPPALPPESAPTPEPAPMLVEQPAAPPSEAAASAESFPEPFRPPSSCFRRVFFAMPIGLSRKSPQWKVFSGYSAWGPTRLEVKPRLPRVPHQGTTRVPGEP